MIEKAIEDHNCIVLNTGQPTHMTTNGHITRIDVSLATSQLAGRCNWQVKNNMIGSDHTSITIIVDEQIARTNKGAERWKIKKADWPLFKLLGNTMLTNTNVYDSNIDQYCENIVSTLNSMAGKAVPKTKSGKNTRLKPLLFWNDDIK